MKVHVMTGSLGLAEAQTVAHRAADAGFSGLILTEAGRTAYLSCAAVALSGADVDLATGVAVAFPRSPMVTASVAWELAEATGGRFRLGIGPQVKAHIERRYSSEFEHPGPRMREYVLAMRAIFRAFRGDERLAFDGDFYRMSLLPAMWSPGPIDVPDPPIDVAAVNPWLLRAAGEVADGVHVHPLNTPTYLRETLVPKLAEGAARAGRDPSQLALYLPLFTVAGDTDEERSRWREAARTMVGFYGSTPNYAFLFEQIGFPGTTQLLREAQKAGDPTGPSRIITDEILGHVIVEGTWEEMPGLVVDRCAEVGDHDVHVVLYLAGMALRQGGETFEKFGRLARGIIGRSS